MKAEDVLRQYAAGERDFRRVNIRGQSFKGKNLSGTDFSEADIRGTNFTNATLEKAKFCGAKAGLQRRWQMGLTGIALLLSAVSGILCGFSGYFVVHIFGSYPGKIGVVWLAIGVIFTFRIVLIRKGINPGVFPFAIVGAFAFASAGAEAFAFGGAVAFAVAGALAGAVAIVVARAITNLIAFALVKLICKTKKCGTY